MVTIELKYLAYKVWVYPSCYAGFSPDGDYCIFTQHRESACLDRSNYISAFNKLRKVCEKYPEPDEEHLGSGFMQVRGEISPRSAGWVYDWRASHPLVGWIEYLMVRQDAPQEVLEAAEKILDRHDGYPVVDEDHYSQMEWDEACEYWESLSVRERAEMIRDTKCGVSIFAGRRPELPQGDNGHLYEQLTAI